MTATAESLHDFWAAFADHVLARILTPADEFDSRDPRLPTDDLDDIDAMMRRGCLLVQANKADAVAHLCSAIDEFITEAFKRKAQRTHLLNVVAEFRFATEEARARLDPETAQEVWQWIVQAFDAADALRADEVNRLLDQLRDMYRLPEADVKPMFGVNAAELQAHADV